MEATLENDDGMPAQAPESAAPTTEAAATEADEAPVMVEESAAEAEPDAIAEEEEIVRHACPGPGSCAGLFTANTMAILTEATLSFLGVGVPPTEPSLGTLIRIGNDFLFSGEWWITVFPGAALAILVLAVNLLGDWMRDAFNPKLR